MVRDTGRPTGPRDPRHSAAESRSRKQPMSDKRFAKERQKGCGAALPRVRLGNQLKQAEAPGARSWRSCGTYEEQWEKASAASMHTQQAERTGRGRLQQHGQYTASRTNQRDMVWRSSKAIPLEQFTVRNERNKRPTAGADCAGGPHCAVRL